jgi:hypothetical protein
MSAPKPTHRCVCFPDCRAQTYATFAQGHDARYRERMRGLLLAGVLSVDEVRHLTVTALGHSDLFRQIMAGRA